MSATQLYFSNNLHPFIKQESNQKVEKLYEFPDELLISILDYLPPKDLLSFEGTCKAFYGTNFTQQIWKRICVEEFFNFDSTESSKPGYYKEMYKVGFLITKYIFRYQQFLLKPDSMDRIKPKCDSLISYCPSLQVYIERDVCLAKKLSFSAEMEEKKEKFLEELGETGLGRLFRALFEIQNFKQLPPRDFVGQIKCLVSVEEYSCKAIDAKASCIAIFAFSQFENQHDFNQNQCCTHIYTYAAEHHDTRSLEKFISRIIHNPSLNLIGSQQLLNYFRKRFGTCGPVLYLEAGLTQDKLEKMKLLTQAMATYKHRICPELWFDAGNALYELNKDLKELNDLHLKAYDAFGELIPPEYLADAALLNYNSKKLAKATIYLNKIIDIFGKNQIPQNLQYETAALLFYFGHIAESDNLMDRLLETLGDQASIAKLHQAAIIKVELEKWNEAEVLYSRVIQAYGEAQVPSNIWFEASQVKFKLGKWIEMKRLAIKGNRAMEKEKPSLWTKICASSARVDGYVLDKFSSLKRFFTDNTG